MKVGTHFIIYGTVVMVEGVLRPLFDTHFGFLPNRPHRHRAMFVLIGYPSLAKPRNPRHALANKANLPFSHPPQHLETCGRSIIFDAPSTM
jgi:hypothetical protein